MKNKIVMLSLQGGLSFGLLSILNLTLQYNFPDLFNGTSFWVITILLIIIYIFIYLKTTQGEIQKYGKLYISAYLMLLMGGIISFGSNLLLHSVIDPSYKEILAKSSVDKYNSWKEEFETSEGVQISEEPDEEEKIYKSTFDSHTPSGIFFSFLQGLLFNVVGAGFFVLISFVANAFKPKEVKEIIV